MLVAAAAMVALVPPTEAAAKQAVVLEIGGAIGPAIADYLMRELRAAKPSEIGLIVLRMNTPGGLFHAQDDQRDPRIVGPGRDLCRTERRAGGERRDLYRLCKPPSRQWPPAPISAPPPRFSLAESRRPDQPAGQRNGQDKEKSAEPVDTETRKAVNDAVAYICSLADLNHRNADWAVEAVRAAASRPASEALKLHVIDAIADDVPDLLRKIDGRTVTIAGQSERPATAGLKIVTVAPDWRTDLLAVITNPNVAFILMLIGVYGLIFEFLNPGAVAPGLTGTTKGMLPPLALPFLPDRNALQSMRCMPAARRRGMPGLRISERRRIPSPPPLRP
jgi:membrane-bound serine protease (ClpP class)